MRLTEYEIYRSMFECNFFDKAFSYVKPINLENAFKSAGDKEIKSVPGERKEGYIKRKMDWYLSVSKKFKEKDKNNIGYLLTAILVSLMESYGSEIEDPNDPVEILTCLIPNLIGENLDDLALTVAGFVSVIYADELGEKGSFTLQIAEVFHERDIGKLVQFVDSIGAEALLDNFEKIIGNFTDDFNGLHGELVKAASALKKEKVLPNAELEKNISRLKNEFNEFTKIVLDVHGNLSETKIEVKGLNDLVAAVEEIKSLKDTQGIMQVVEQIGAILKLSVTIASDDLEVDSLLEEVRKGASKLLGELEKIKGKQDQEKVSAISDETQKYKLMNHFVEGFDDLEYKEKRELHSKLKQDFSPELMDAVMFGRLHFYENEIPMTEDKDKDKDKDKEKDKDLELLAEEERKEDESPRGDALSTENEKSAKSTKGDVDAKIKKIGDQKKGNRKVDVAAKLTEESGNESGIKDGQKDEPEKEKDLTPDIVATNTASGLIEFIQDSKSEDSDVWNNLLSSLIAERELNWAYWVSKSLGNNADVPSWLVELLQLGVQYQPGFSNSEQKVSELFKNIVEDDTFNNISGNTSLVLIALAGSIRPSLMSPLTHPSILLRNLGTSLKELHPRLEEFCQSLASFADRGVPIAGELLKDLSMFASWEQQKAELEIETETWLMESPHRKTKYGMATRIWQNWVGNNGQLRSMVERSKVGLDNTGELTKDSELWKDVDGFSQILSRTSQALYPKKKSKKVQIDYAARDALIRYVNDALHLVDQWQDLFKHKPKEDGGLISFSRQTLEHLKAPAVEIMESLEKYLNDGHELLLKTAAIRLHGALSELVSGFQSEKTFQRIDDPLDARIEELLYMPNVSELDMDQNTLEMVKWDVVDYLFNRDGLSESIITHLNLGHLHLVKMAEKSKKAIRVQEAIGSMQGDIDEAERKWNAIALEEIARVSDRISSAYFNMAINDQERSKYERYVQDLEGSEENPDIIINKCKVLLKDVELVFSERLNEALENVKSLKKTLAKKGIKVPERFDGILDEHLKREELSSINELVVLTKNAVANGNAEILEQVSPIAEGQSYYEDFADINNEVFTEALDLVRLQRQLRNKKVASLPTLNILKDNEHRDSLAAIKWWHGISSPPGKRNIEGDIVANFFRLFRWLGFHVDSGERMGNPLNSQGSPYFWRHYRINATIESPIPLYGSMAHGKYDVVLVWNNPEPDMVVNYLKAQVSRDRPVIVLYFGTLNEEGRRRFIHQSRGEGFCPLLMDSCLMLWLCTFRAAERTKAMFGVGIFGGHNNPYTPEMAGSVPPETFFGRNESILDLWKLDGPCIVYGGRQLGKSALLQEVKRRYHDTEKHHYVFYSGIKTSAFIWTEIFNKLREPDLLKEKRLTRDDSIKNSILSLLNTNPSMRILMLMDECDYFLDEDSKKGFAQTSLVRDLMAETDRRFKVVFTGLHSVQRFRRIPNQPLAHFGEPICVGPLDHISARELVRKPLGDLGCIFQPPSLTERVLAHTNYHPNLIQFFCSFLMRAVLLSKKYNKDTTPPFVIDSQLIDQVYNNRDLVKKMRERFDWTLNLDTRYRALGYMIAWLELLTSKEEGFTVKEILGNLRAQWPVGFENSNTEEIGGLLEEMVGLGLLIDTVQGRKYKLRSPNVLRLLGDEDEIADEIEMLEDVGLEQKADPQVFRRILRGDGEAKSRILVSPFTMKQENILLRRESGVDLIIGSNALEIGKSNLAIKDLIYTREHSKVEIVSSELEDNTSKLIDHVQRKISKLEDGEGAYFILQCDENKECLRKETIDELSSWRPSGRRKNCFVRFGIVTNPPICWDLIKTNVISKLEDDPSVSTVRLNRWREPGLSHWFHDMDVVPEESSLPSKWVETTGGWPMVLDHVQRHYLDNKEDITKSEEFKVENYELPLNSGLLINQNVQKAYRVLCELDEEMSSLDLAGFIDGIEPDKVDHIVEYLLAMDLVIGTADSMKAEPTMARILIEQD